MDKNHNPARNEGETHEEYRSRRRNGNQAIRWYLTSRFGEQLRWLSTFQGPYKKGEGELLTPSQATNLLRTLQKRVGPQSDSPLVEEVTSSLPLEQVVDPSGEVPLEIDTMKP